MTSDSKNQIQKGPTESGPIITIFHKKAPFRGTIPTPEVRNAEIRDEVARQLEGRRP